MRRLVGISIRSAVAMTLPLVGAIYLAAEARQAILRRYSAGNVQPLASAVSQSPNQNLARARGKALPGQTAKDQKPAATPDTRSSAPPSPDPAQDERAAELQAAEMPAQQPSTPAVQDQHTRQIVISIPDRRLALLEDGELVNVYPIAVGKSSTPSPEGDYSIINHAVNPVYRHEGQEIGPGKNNPLGTRWMGLSLKGYGIHGTNVQSSVGKAASHGCFRMKKKDVEELYTKVRVGDAVSIRGERDELTATLFNGKPAGPVTAGDAVAQIASTSVANPTSNE